MSVITHIGLGGKVSHEYSGQIDFRINAERMDWQVLTWMPAGNLSVGFISHMANLQLWDLFHVKERPLNSCEQIAMTFRPRKMPNDKATDARRKLLSFLTKHKLKIVWKEATHGYDINRSGRIHRKWRLNTVYERLPGPINF